MLLRLIRGDCHDKSCPALHQTDRDTLVVQGWEVTDGELLGQLDLPAGMQAVEVPADLLAGVIDSWPTLRRTGHGTLIVTGMTVTDPDALRQLRLTANEQAVELPADTLARVLQAC